MEKMNIIGIRMTHSLPKVICMEYLVLPDPLEYFRAVKKSGGVNAYEAIQQAKEAQILSETREDFGNTAE